LQWFGRGGRGCCSGLVGGGGRGCVAVVCAMNYSILVV